MALRSDGEEPRANQSLLLVLSVGVDALVTAARVDDIPCMGISTLTSLDFWYAKEQMKDGQPYTIKLIGTAAQSKNGDDKLAVYVSPVLLKKSNVLAGIHGAVRSAPGWR